jgi:hypothetical protein
MTALVLWWSKTGNSRTVAQTVESALVKCGLEVTVREMDPALDLDYAGYDIVALSFPSYQWHPPGPVCEFLAAQNRKQRDAGRIVLGAPPREGKKVLVFCTYSGPHTGINEAVPAAKYAGQFFEHAGYPIAVEHCVVGEFHGRKDASTRGRLGDIRGRPNEQDLREVEELVVSALRS